MRHKRLFNQDAVSTVILVNLIVLAHALIADKSIINAIGTIVLADSIYFLVGWIVLESHHWSKK